MSELPCFLDLTGNICVGVLAKGLGMVHVGQLADVVPVGLQGTILGDVVSGEAGQSETERGNFGW